MAASDISALRANIRSHVETAIGTTGWAIREGRPRSYAPPCAYVWFSGIPSFPPPNELRELPYQFTVRLVATSASDPEQDDKVEEAFEAIYNEYLKLDAVAGGGYAQEAYISSVVPFMGEYGDDVYPGLDLTITAIVKRPDAYTV